MGYPLDLIHPGTFHLVSIPLKTLRVNYSIHGCFLLSRRTTLMQRLRMTWSCFPGTFTLSVKSSSIHQPSPEDLNRPLNISATFNLLLDDRSVMVL